MNENDFCWAFTPAKVVIYQSINSSYLIWRAFGARPEFFYLLNKFKRLFLKNSLQPFWPVFVFEFLKWNLTLRKIY